MTDIAESGNVRAQAFHYTFDRYSNWLHAVDMLCVRPAQTFDRYSNWLYAVDTLCVRPAQTFDRYSNW